MSPTSYQTAPPRVSDSTRRASRRKPAGGPVRIAQALAAVKPSARPAEPKARRSLLDSGSNQAYVLRLRGHSLPRSQWLRVRRAESEHSGRRPGQAPRSREPQRDGIPIVGLLLGLSAAELQARPGVPILMKKRDLLPLNEIDVSLGQWRGRTQGDAGGGEEAE